MRKLLATLCLAAIAGSAFPAAPAADPLAGTWVWPVEDRTLVVLVLKAGPNGLTGTMQRPARLSISQSGAGLAVHGIELPISTVPVEYVRSATDGHVLRMRNPDGTSSEFLLRADGEGALMGFGMEPGVPVAHLVRPRDPAVAATDWDRTRGYLARAPAPESLREMAEIYAADQADRKIAPSQIDWTSVAPRDTARRARVRQLLDDGLLNSGDDYYYAAMVFQHGEQPADYLLAHVLAMASQSRGRPDAAWIATASLDRYLHSIGKPQLFGTQYPNSPDGKVSQGDYDQTLVPDNLRPALGLPTREQEAALMKQLESARQPGAATGPAPAN